MSFTKTISVALLPPLFTALMILERSAVDTVSVLRAITPSKRVSQNASLELWLRAEARRFLRAALGLFHNRGR